MPFVEIADPADPRLADYRALTDVSLRLAIEPAEGLFIAESALVVARVLRAGYQLRSVLVSPRHAADLEVPAQVPTYVASDLVLRGVTGFHVHRGVLASVHRRPLPSAAQVVAGASRVAVLEDVNTHTNVGAIFRSAAALGVDAVLLSPRCADPLYRRSVRVSMGAVFAVPYARLEPWPSGLGWLAQLGFRVLALSPDGELRLDEAGARADRVALLLGAEGQGLSPAARTFAAGVSIPMGGGIDSLNVAAAAAVAFWELRVNRRPADAAATGAAGPGPGR